MGKGKSFYEQTLSAIFTYIADGALIVDRRGKVVAMNDALQKMMGWQPEEVIGKRTCYALFGCRRQEESGQEICCPGFTLPSSPDPHDAYQVMMLVTSEGDTVQAWISCAPLPDMGPDSPAALILVRDVSNL
jgi:PAS domain S-box-containing protein